VADCWKEVGTVGEIGQERSSKWHRWISNVGKIPLFFRSALVGSIQNVY